MIRAFFVAATLILVAVMVGRGQDQNQPVTCLRRSCVSNPQQLLVLQH